MSIYTCLRTPTFLHKILSWDEGRGGRVIEYDGALLKGLGLHQKQLHNRLLLAKTDKVRYGISSNMMEHA